MSSKLFLFLSAFVFAEDYIDTREATPAGQEIAVSQDDVKILVHAEKILSKESKWDRKDNRECPEPRKAYSLFCALYKASVEVNGKFDHRGAAMEELRRTVEEFSKGKSYEHRLMGYNNDPSTTFKDIQRVLRSTKKRIQKKLKKK